MATPASCARRHALFESLNYLAPFEAVERAVEGVRADVFFIKKRHEGPTWDPRRSEENLTIWIHNFITCTIFFFNYFFFESISYDIFPTGSSAAPT